MCAGLPCSCRLPVHWETVENGRSDTMQVPAAHSSCCHIESPGQVPADLLGGCLLRSSSTSRRRCDGGRHRPSCRRRNEPQAAGSAIFPGRLPPAGHRCQLPWQVGGRPQGPQAQQNPDTVRPHMLPMCSRQTSHAAVWLTGSHARICTVHSTAGGSTACSAAGTWQHTASSWLIMLGCPQSQVPVYTHRW